MITCRSQVQQRWTANCSSTPTRTWASTAVSSIQMPRIQLPQTGIVPTYKEDETNLNISDWIRPNAYEFLYRMTQQVHSSDWRCHRIGTPASTRKRSSFGDQTCSAPRFQRSSYHVLWWLMVQAVKLVDVYVAQIMVARSKICLAIERVLLSRMVEDWSRPPSNPRGAWLRCETKGVWLPCTAWCSDAALPAQRWPRWSHNRLSRATGICLWTTLELVSSAKYIMVGVVSNWHFFKTIICIPQSLAVSRSTQESPLRSLFVMTD